MKGRLAPVTLLALLFVTAGSARSADIAGKYIVVREHSAGQSSLELRTFPSESVRALTPRPVAGERRTECCARFSPDGSKLAFERSTPTSSKLLVLDLESKVIRTVHQLPAGRSRFYVWAQDSRALLYSTYRQALGTVQKFQFDGSVAMVSRFRSRDGLTWPEGTSPDGFWTLVVESEGEPLYFHYEGPDILYAVGQGKRVKLATTASLGRATWSPDASLVAYSANCFSTCRIEVVRPDGKSRRILRRFRSRTNQSGGFDGVSFAWAGRIGEIVYGRGRTLYGIDAATGEHRRIRTLPCPDQRCDAPETTIESLSLERDTAFVWVSDTTSYIEDGSDTLGRLYRVSLLSGAFSAANRLEDASDIWFGHVP